MEADGKSRNSRSEPRPVPSRPVLVPGPEQRVAPVAARSAGCTSIVRGTLWEMELLREALLALLALAALLLLLVNTRKDFTGLLLEFVPLFFSKYIKHTHIMSANPGSLI